MFREKWKERSDPLCSDIEGGEIIIGFAEIDRESKRQRDSDKLKNRFLREKR